jgi:hypothetical protein
MGEGFYTPTPVPGEAHRLPTFDFKTFRFLDARAAPLRPLRLSDFALKSPA